MTAMNETSDHKNPDDLNSSADDVDNGADESLEAADTNAPDSAPAQPATTAHSANRSANIGH